MEVKKARKSDLEGKKTIFFEVGLILALSILLFAFEWKTETSKNKGIEMEAQVQEEEERIPITEVTPPPQQPPPAAPKLADIITVVENDEILDEELEIEDAESDAQNEVVDITKFNDYEEEDTGEAKIFTIVETSPSFKGNVQVWLSKHIQYPTLAQENGIQGKVYVHFVVEKDGSITDVKIQRGVDPSLDKEAVRAVKSMPKWNPGKQRGKPVRVYFTLPVNFLLNN